MAQQKIKPEQFIAVIEGQCEHCGYDYTQDHLTINASPWMVKCPKCGKYGTNFVADETKIEAEHYDFEKENNKKCPVCEKIIDYHVDGFIHYEAENVWVHREHTVEETEKALTRPLTEMEKAWITY